MAKRSYEIDDTLQGCVDSAIESVKEELLNHLKANPDTDELPELGNDLDYSGAIHEIIDGSVPIYTQEIKDIMYLHGDEVEQAFDDAGIGEKKDEGWPMGWQAAAIYCYIEEKVNEWYSSNAQDIFDEWLESKPKEAEGGGEEEKGGGEEKSAEGPPPGASPSSPESAATEALRRETSSVVKHLLEG